MFQHLSYLHSVPSEPLGTFPISSCGTTLSGQTHILCRDISTSILAQKRENHFKGGRRAILRGCKFAELGTRVAYLLCVAKFFNVATALPISLESPLGQNQPALQVLLSNSCHHSSLFSAFLTGTCQSAEPWSHWLCLWPWPHW